MAQLVEVVIDSVRVSLTNQQRIVLLREKQGERFLPIWIGPYEAEAITVSLQEIEVARPQTHDLLLSALATIGSRLLRVEVVALKGEVFYGNLVVIKHELSRQETSAWPAFPTPVFTLYAHLSQISVEPGEVVSRGQQIGLVGMTGSALGNHLHFEVRLGENTYQAVSNPELWLAPGLAENGQQKGIIAGRVISAGSSSRAGQSPRTWDP